jgi:hypothetical protein
MLDFFGRKLSTENHEVNAPSTGPVLDNSVKQTCKRGGGALINMLPVSLFNLKIKYAPPRVVV